LTAASIFVVLLAPVTARASYTLSFAGTSEFGSVTPGVSQINITNPTTFFIKDTSGHVEFTVTLTAGSSAVTNDGVLTSGVTMTVADDDTGSETDTLKMTLSSTPYVFTNGASPATLSLTSTVSGNLPSIFDFGSFQSTAQNNITGTTHSTTPQMTFLGLWPGAASTTFSNVAPGNPSVVSYTLVNVFTLTLHGGETLSLLGKTELTGDGPPVTPEPATLVMAATGIPLAILIACLRHRRRNVSRSLDGETVL
jgi:hypothetical protein